jgi:hypothetical protein
MSFAYLNQSRVGLSEAGLTFFTLSEHVLTMRISPKSWPDVFHFASTPF